MTASDDGDKAEVIRQVGELARAAYSDALAPVSKEIGKALGTLGRAVNVALAPLRALVWSFEQIENYLKTTVALTLDARNVPPERIQPPDIDIAVPAIEALRYSNLRENYAKLLATAMDTQSAGLAHPAFVEVLKQITSDEAKILNYLPRVGLYEPLVDLTVTRGNAGTRDNEGSSVRRKG